MATAFGYGKGEKTLRRARRRDRRDPRVPASPPRRPGTDPGTQSRRTAGGTASGLSIRFADEATALHRRGRRCSSGGGCRAGRTNASGSRRRASSTSSNPASIWTAARALVAGRAEVRRGQSSCGSAAAASTWPPGARRLPRSGRSASARSYVAQSRYRRDRGHVGAATGRSGSGASGRHARPPARRPRGLRDRDLAISPDRRWVASSARGQHAASLADAGPVEAPAAARCPARSSSRSCTR